MADLALIDDIELEREEEPVDSDLVLEENEMEEYTKDVNVSSDVPLDDSLRIFINEASKYKNLTPEEEIKYATAYRNKGDKKARELLVSHNLRLVVNVAKRFHLSHPETALEDLISAGNMGLVKGIDRYDPKKGYRVTTYCIWWIRQSIVREIQNNGSTIRIPVHMHERVVRYNRFVAEYSANNNQKLPTNEEIMEGLHINHRQMGEIRAAQVPIVSLDMPVGEEEDSQLIDFIEASSNVEETSSGIELQHAMKELLDATLNEREKDIIYHRFGFIDGECHTLEEVGAKYGVTRERIRQLEAKAMRKLRHPKRMEVLRHMLG